MTVPTPASRAAVWTNMGIVYVIWGSTYFAIAILIQSVPPMLGMGVRFVCAGILLGLILIATRGREALHVTRREGISAAGLGVLMLGGGIGVVALAERYVPSGVAALLVASVPIWAVLLRTVTGERPHLLTWLGIAIGLIGVAVLVRPTGEGFSGDRVLWSLLIVAGQVLFALGSFLTPKLGVPKDALVLVTYEMFFGGLMYFVWSRVGRESVDVSAITAHGWAALTYLIASAVVGYGAYTWLLSHVSLSIAMTYAYVNPVVAVILGTIGLHEPITWAIVIGGAITIAGVFLVITGERAETDEEVVITQAVESR